MMNYYLYRYMHNDSGKIYVGITNNVVARCSRHVRGKSGALAFNNAVKKYGIDAFDFCILATYESVEEAQQMEQMAINVLGSLSPHGYNLRAGSPYALYGGALSQETREKISNAKKGVPRSEEAKHNTAIAQIGRVPSKETRQKLSIALKGKPKPIRNRHHYEEICKTVLQFTKSGELVHEYKSVKDAAKAIGVLPASMGNYCNDRRIPGGDYTWKFCGNSRNH
jgi:group I intron endonuclease